MLFKLAVVFSVALAIYGLSAGQSIMVIVGCGLAAGFVVAAWLDH